MKKAYVLIWTIFFNITNKSMDELNLKHIQLYSKNNPR